MVDFAHLRERMVADQIAARGVRDAKVLAAMRKVRREVFVPLIGEQGWEVEEPGPEATRPSVARRRPAVSETLPSLIMRNSEHFSACIASTG
jgi:hypothetical protein